MALLGTGDQSLNIVVRLKDEASKQLDAFKGKVEKMEPAFTKMAAVGTAAFVGISAVAAKSIAAFGEAERAQRQLEHAVIGVSKGTQEQVLAIEELANAMQKKAGVDADSVKMGAAQLSTFGLQSKSVVDLTKSLTDLTLNQNGVNASADAYVSSANTIAKALNGQFGVLEKSGIRFTELQQAMILTGTEAEKVAAINEGLAQNLRETTDTIGGVDVAMAKFSRTTEDIQENIGAALVPALNELMEKVMPVITAFANWAQENPKLLGKIILVAGGVSALVAVVGALGLVIPSVIAGFGLLFSVGGAVVVALGLIVAAGVYLYQHWDELKEKVAVLGQKLVDTWNYIKDTISKVITDTTGAIKQWVLDHEYVTGAIVGLLSAMVAKGFVVLVQYIATTVIPAVISFGVTLVTQTIPALISFIATTGTQAITALIAFGASIITTAVGSLVAFATTIWTTVIPAVVAFSVALATNPIVWIAALGIAIGVLVVAIVKNWDTIVAKTSSMWAAVKAGFKDGVNGLIGLAEAWANSYVKAANIIIGALNKIQISVPDWVPEIGGKSFGVNIDKVPEVSLPRFEQGGLVPGTRGTPVPIIAHGGEMVIPAGNVNNAGGGVNITIEMNYPQFKSQEDITIVRNQIELALRDVVRNYKLQPA